MLVSEGFGPDCSPCTSPAHGLPPATEPCARSPRRLRHAESFTPRAPPQNDLTPQALFDANTKERLFGTFACGKRFARIVASVEKMLGRPLKDDEIVLPLMIYMCARCRGRPVPLLGSLMIVCAHCGWAEPPHIEPVKCTTAPAIERY